jgi:NAD(P)-dependent dehydrogenase (short-subunit alcohol dehydrogenase family)
MATYLITGANRGIGCEFCRQLQQRGDQVIAVCRQASEELKAISLQNGVQNNVQLIQGIDITDDASVQALKQELANRPIDVLINNAGIIEWVTLEDLDFDSIRRQFEVNALGALRVTQALLPNLQWGAKVIMMTSRMGSIEDNTSGSSYGYRMSKVALSMAGKSLSHDLKPKGIAVAILHPGLVQTRMTNFSASGITPEVSVQGLLARIAQLTLENTGTFWHSNGEVLPW